jgi:Glyoxalase-like domain
VPDAEAASHALVRAGFAPTPISVQVHPDPDEMQRVVDVGGQPATAAFTIARVEAGEMPESRMQILTHRTEPMVWQPRWLSHPNGAQALMRILVAVADVAEAARRFGRFTGRAPVPTPFGHAIELESWPRRSPRRARLLPELSIPSLPFVGAYGIRMKSLTVAAGLLTRAGLIVRQHDRDLIAIFPPELGHGAWLFHGMKTR